MIFKNYQLDAHYTWPRNWHLVRTYIHILFKNRLCIEKKYIYLHSKVTIWVLHKISNCFLTNIWILKFRFCLKKILVPRSHDLNVRQEIAYNHMLEQEARSMLSNRYNFRCLGGHNFIPIYKSKFVLVTVCM